MEVATSSTALYIVPTVSLSILLSSASAPLDSAAVATKTSVASELTRAICMSGLLPDPSSNPARA